MKKVLAAARDNPELVKVPTVRVQDEDAESRALLSALPVSFLWRLHGRHAGF